MAHFELPHLTVHCSIDPAEAAHNEPPHGSTLFADSSVILNTCINRNALCSQENFKIGKW